MSIKIKHNLSNPNHLALCIIYIRIIIYTYTWYIDSYYYNGVCMTADPRAHVKWNGDSPDTHIQGHSEGRLVAMTLGE